MRRLCRGDLSLRIHLLLLPLAALLVLATGLSIPGAVGAESVASPGALSVASPEELSITPPPGWDRLPGLSKTIAQSASEVDYFGKGVSFSSGAMAYGRVSLGALYLTWARSTKSLAAPEASIRNAFDELHASPALASSKVGTIREVLYRERSFDGIVEMRFEWAHLANETVNIVRALAWQDPKARVHLAIAECVLQSENISDTRPGCEKSLEALALGASTAHKPLRALADPLRVARPSEKAFEIPRLETGDLSTGAGSPGATMGAPPLQPGRILYEGEPAKKEGYSSGTIIAVGLLLLGIASWLTSRSSPVEEDKDEDEDQDENEDQA